MEEVTPLCRNGSSVDDKITKWPVTSGTSDAPATSFALNAKYIHDYFGRLKDNPALPTSQVYRKVQNACKKSET